MNLWAPLFVENIGLAYLYYINYLYMEFGMQRNNYCLVSVPFRLII